MQKHLKSGFYIAGLFGTILGGGLGHALAAHVPDGVVLAKKQVLVRNNDAELQGLDPAKVEGTPEDAALSDLFEPLTLSGPEGETEPGVAERWETKDFKEWVFYLRENARWSNGDPVTAHDFVYALRRLVDPKTGSPYSSYLGYGHVLNNEAIFTGKKPLESLGVEALDDRRLAFHLEEATPYLPKLLSHISTVPVPKKIIEKYGDAWTQPGKMVSNGAYRLKERVLNEKLVFERNPYYWDNVHTVIAQVTLLPIVSGITGVIRYRGGEIDVGGAGIPVAQYNSLRKEIPNEIKTGPLLCTYYYEINNKKPPFNDPRVREALKIGFDQDIIALRVVGQGRNPAYSYLQPAVNGAVVEKPDWYAKMDQAARNRKAKKLLAEAGYNEKHPLNVEISYNTLEDHKLIASAIASMWGKNLGVQVKLTNDDWKTFLDRRHSGDYQVARAGWCADYNEPSAFLNTMLSNSTNNTAFYKSKEFDDIMAQSSRVKSEEERTKLYTKAEQILDKDSAIIPIYYYVLNRLVKPYVGGYAVNNPLGHMYTKDMYIIKH